VRRCRRHLPNEAAIRRLVGAELLAQSDEWAVQRARYMPRDTPAEVVDPSQSELAVLITRPNPIRHLPRAGSYTTQRDTISAGVLPHGSGFSGAEGDPS